MFKRFLNKLTRKEEETILNKKKKREERKDQQGKNKGDQIHNDKM